MLPPHMYASLLPTFPPLPLQAVLGATGVRSYQTTTNHIMEVQQYLGIGE